MLHIILKIVGLGFLLIGVIMVYDARLITHQYFSFGDQNDASTGLKILGFLICMIGGIIVYFVR